MGVDLSADFAGIYIYIGFFFAPSDEEFSIQVSCSHLLITDVCTEGCFVSYSSYQPPV